MKRLVIMFLAITSSLVLGATLAEAGRMNQLDNVRLNSALINGSYMAGDYPTPSIVTGSNGAQVLQINWSDNANTSDTYGSVTIPVGAVPDAKYVRVVMKIISKTGNPSLTISGNYVTPASESNTFSAVCPASTLIPGYNRTTKPTNTAWTSDPRSFLNTITFSISGASAGLSFEIDNLEAISSTNVTTDLYGIDWSFAIYAIPPVVPSTPIYKGDHPIYLGDNATDIIDSTARADLLAIKTDVPNVGCAFGGSFQGITTHKDFTSANNLPFFMQNNAIQSIETFISEQQAHAVDSWGNSVDATPTPGYIMYSDYCHPAMLQAYSTVMACLGQTGVPEFQFIDSVWPCDTACVQEWGYSTSDIQAYRNDLLGLDSGLVKGVTGQSGTVVKFADYLRDSTGAELGVTITPAGMGLTSWSQYNPCVSAWTQETNDVGFNLQNYFLMIMLKHYEWLKFMSNVGGYAKANNVRLSVMPNGDNWQNANDYVGLLQLANVDVAVDETHFYNPNGWIRWVPRLSAWRALATKYGKHHRLISEEGVGGGAGIYLDPRVSYILHYLLTAYSHYDSMEDDWMSSVHVEMANTFTGSRYIDFLMKSYGFNHATADNSEKTIDPNKILYICPMEINRINYANLYLGNAVVGSAISTVWMDQRTAVDLDAISKAKVIIYDPNAGSPIFASALCNAVASSPKSVIFHSYTPGTMADGANYAELWGADYEHINNSGMFSSLIGNVGLYSYDPPSGDVALLGGGTIPFSYTGAMYGITASATPIATINGQPLVSRVTLPNGSKVYYMHFVPGASSTLALEKYVISLAMADQGLSPEGTATNCLLHRFTTKDGYESVVMLNQQCLTSYTGPYAPNDYPFPYESNGASATATFSTSVATPFKIYDFMNGTDLGTFNTPSVTLNLQNASAGLYYIYPQSQESTFKSNIGARNTLVSKWLNEYKGFTSQYTPVAYETARQSAPSGSRFLVWSASMDPSNQGLTDGTTLEFRVRKAGQNYYSLLGQHNLNGVFSESTLMSLPLDPSVQDVILDVNYNASTAYDSTIVYKFRVMDANGAVLQDLSRQPSAPTFTRGLLFGLNFDSDPAKFTAAGGYISLDSSHRIGAHPGWNNGYAAPVWGKFRIDPKRSLYLECSAQMDPANQGLTDGTTLQFSKLVQGQSSFTSVGQVNLMGVFSPSPISYMPLNPDGEVIDQIKLTVDPNTNTAYDDTLISPLRVIDAEGVTVANLVEQADSPYLKGLTINGVQDINPSDFVASGAVMAQDGVRVDTLDAHPGWNNGLVGPVWTVFATPQAHYSAWDDWVTPGGAMAMWHYVEFNGTWDAPNTSATVDLASAVSTTNFDSWGGNTTAQRTTTNVTADQQQNDDWWIQRIISPRSCYFDNWWNGVDEPQRWWGALEFIAPSDGMYSINASLWDCNMGWAGNVQKAWVCKNNSPVFCSNLAPCLFPTAIYPVAYTDTVNLAAGDRFFFFGTTNYLSDDGSAKNCLANYRYTGSSVDLYLEPVATDLSILTDLAGKQDGTLLRVSGVVTAVYGDCFYIEQRDRVRGIKVVGNIKVSVDDEVTISGRLRTVAGEQRIVIGS